jgi:plasmid maintenance system antidote protein VapI
MKLASAEVLRAFVGPEENKKTSGRKLARAAGCHPSFIDHLLAGRKSSCTPVMAARISEVLGVPVEVLFVPSIPSSKRQSTSRSAA